MSETNLDPADWTPTEGGRLARLLSYLEEDPDNASLLTDAAESALDERAPKAAWDLLARLAAIQPLTPAQDNLLGIASMQVGDFEGASKSFERLLEEGHDDPALRFNAAWCAAACGQPDKAAGFIDDATAAALPSAAMLEVRLLHDGGEMDEALARARRRLSQHPDDNGLAATVSVLAIDLEDLVLARRCAELAGDHPDALTTLGMIALNEGRSEEATAFFERTLSATRKAPRAVVGRGLARLQAGDLAGGAADLDEAAQAFGTHLGSWIAAGWAHYTKGDVGEAKARFERALSIDDTFSECHGSLAVIDVLEGRAEEARRRVRTAFGLDRACYSAALAQALLEQAEGDAAAARAVMARALHMPVGSDGQTIAQAITRMGLRTS